MADTVTARNNSLTVVEEGKSLASDFKSKLIDFNEMNTVAIQAVVSGQDAEDGTFSLEVSLICDPNSFIPYDGSERTMDADCNNFGWEYRMFPWRYVRVCYTNGTLTTGQVTIYARGRRT